MTAIEASVQTNEDEFNDPDAATVCLLFSVSKYKLKMYVGGKEFKAIVDTVTEYLRSV